MTLLLYSLLLSLSCNKTEPTPAPDLSERLGPDQSRAGFVVEPDSLFAGVSAEGRIGDIKIYNDRVQFILQGDRPGMYYIEQAGGVVDADVVRPQGELGRDLVDDFAGMYGLGRMGELREITVLSDGSDGPAQVRFEGGEGALGILVGALGGGDAVPNLGLQICTDYTLEPGSNLLRVQTTVRAEGGEARFAPGDLLIGSLDAAEQWTPGAGFEPAELDDFAWTGFVGTQGQGAVALLAEQGERLQVDASAQLLASLAEMSLGLGERVELAQGEELVWTRYYGVASDLATLSDASLALQGASVQSYQETVTAPDGAVAGAWVTVSVDGVPFTIAQSDADGVVRFDAPAGAQVTLQAQGRARSVTRDYAQGAVAYSPYLVEPLRAQVLSAYLDGAPGALFAEGRGVAQAQDPLVLQEPGTLRVQIDSPTPFEVRLARSEGEPATDPALVLSRSTSAMGWGLDGELSMQVEPGEYEVLIYKGSRYELAQARVSVVAGETAELSLSLEPAWSLPGWIVADPHSHAAPSADGGCTMEDRLSASAARGIQLHFGTDHDHIADYRPLIGALGLEQHMASVLASEMSHVIRGHINVYPLSLDTQATNGGAFPWWSTPMETTEQELELLRDWYPGAVIQYNHPTGSGVAQAAGWSPGRVSKPSAWSNELDAMELLNAGKHQEYFELYVDLVNRGTFPTPVGVSDSHRCTSGGLGQNLTYLALSSDPRGYSPELLQAAMASRATVVSNGPMILLDPPPGSLLTGSARLDYQVLSPSWIGVDRVVLYRDGEAVEVSTSLQGSFELEPTGDASYIVVAEGDAGMSPISSQLPWAMTSAVLVDVAGDGWEPLFEPFE